MEAGVEPIERILKREHFQEAVFSAPLVGLFAHCI
jgi:hypothetical protein